MTSCKERTEQLEIPLRSNFLQNTERLSSGNFHQSSVGSWYFSGLSPWSLDALDGTYQVALLSYVTKSGK